MQVSLELFHRCCFCLWESVCNHVTLPLIAYHPHDYLYISLPTSLSVPLAEFFSEIFHLVKWLWSVAFTWTTRSNILSAQLNSKWITLYFCCHSICKLYGTLIDLCSYTLYKIICNLMVILHRHEAEKMCKYEWYSTLWHCGWLDRMRTRANQKQTDRLMHASSMWVCVRICTLHAHSFDGVFTHTWALNAFNYLMKTSCNYTLT